MVSVSLNSKLYGTILQYGITIEPVVWVHVVLFLVYVRSRGSGATSGASSALAATLQRLTSRAFSLPAPHRCG